MMAAFSRPESKSRNFAICFLMQETLWSTVSTVIILRKSLLPEGSPIMPVPPPIRAMGRCPARCRCAMAMMGI